MARIVLVIQPSPVGISLTWCDGPASFPPYELATKPLAGAADAARRALGSIVGCVLSGEDSELLTASSALANAGYALYQALFKPPAEQMSRATEVRKWLDKLQTDHAVESLEVVADGGDPVPWNLVYDRRPDPQAFRSAEEDPACWLPFWGIRYDLSCGRRVSPLRRFPVLNNPRVVVVTDPFVIDGLPDEARELGELCLAQGWPLVRSRTELVAALGAGRPDLLYWLGHTQEEPFGLVLGEDVLTPEDLRALLESDPFAEVGDVFGGIAFLNACGTAQSAPSGSFQDALHPLGLSGLIATEQITIDTFAAPLGREFLASFAVGGEELGAVMRKMRGRVPLGLVYGSYCPPVLKVRRTAPESKGASVVFTRLTSGTKLGLPGLPAREDRPLPAHPYRSLRAYGVDDCALFAGRDDDVLRFAQLLDNPATRVLILHGESGVGKTSFLRAGVIPFLETECAGYRFARDRSRPDAETVLLIRATNDAASQIATALAAYCARPFTYHTPTGAEATADLPGVLRAALGIEPGLDLAPGAVLTALRAELRADPGLLGRLLAELARALPFAPVLILDQAEEVFTLARTPDDEKNRALALEMLRRAAGTPGGFKLVVSLRTEYHGRFVDRLRKGGGAGVREYLLTEFGFDALVEVIRRPTATAKIPHATEVPFERYKFRFADGVAEEIARSAQAYTLNRQDSVLPLVQVLCLQLYDRVRTRPDATITAADLDALGGVQGGMKRFAEDMVQRLFSRGGDRAAFRRLLGGPDAQLFIQQPDGTLTTALLPAAFLAEHWTGPTPFDEVLRQAGDGDWRLLRVNSLRIGDAVERPYVSLGHDALAHVAARWADERKRWAQLRRFAAAVVVLLAVAGGLFVLSAWALEKEKQANNSALAANDSAAKAKNAQEIAERERAEAGAARDRALNAQKEAEKARRAADKARDEAIRAREEVVKNNRDVTLDALELVKTGGHLGIPELAFLEKVQDRWMKFTAAGNDPTTIAEASFRVAALRSALGKKDEAREWYDRTCRHADALMKSAPDDPSRQFLLARARLNKGLLFAEREEWGNAREDYDRAAKLLDGLIERPDLAYPDLPAYRAARALLHNNSGAVFRSQWLAARERDPGAATKHFEQARDEYERACTVLDDLVNESKSPDRAHEAALATYHKNLGLLHYEHYEADRRRAQRNGNSDPDRAAFDCSKAELEKAYKIWERLAKQNENPGYKLEKLNAKNDLGALYTMRSETHSAARELLASAQTIGEELIRLNSTHPGYRVAVARCLRNLTFVPKTSFAQQIELLDRAIKVLGVYEDLPTEPETRGTLRGIYRRRSYALECDAKELLDRPGNGQEAVKRFKDAYADWEQVIRLSPKEERLTIEYESLGALYGFDLNRALTKLARLQCDPKADWQRGDWYRFAQMYAGAALQGTDAEYSKRIADALACLERAVALGWSDDDAARRDAEKGKPFAALATNPKFKDLCKRMREQKAP